MDPSAPQPSPSAKGTQPHPVEVEYGDEPTTFSAPGNRNASASAFGQVNPSALENALEDNALEAAPMLPAAADEFLRDVEMETADRAPIPPTDFFPPQVAVDPDPTSSPLSLSDPMTTPHPETDAWSPAPENAANLSPAAGEDLPSNVSPAPSPAPTLAINTPADLSEHFQTLENRLNALSQQFLTRTDQLQTAFEREVRAEATREKIVDRLHAELQEYKQDMIFKIMRPVFIDLIQLHDDMGKLLEAESAETANSAAPEAQKLRKTLRGFQQGIEDILYRQGVEPFTEPGVTFDPRRQRAVRTLPTEDPALVRTTALRLRVGFQSGNQMIRPEIVAVYVRSDAPK